MKINTEKFLCLIENIKELKRFPEFDGIFPLVLEIEREFIDIEDLIFISDDLGSELSNTNIISNIAGLKSFIANKKVINKELDSLVKFILNNKPYTIEIIKIEYCKCGGEMMLQKDFYECKNCNAIKTYYQEIPVVENNLIEVNNNSNINKHLIKNISQIYGESKVELPDAVINKICNEMRNRIPCIEDVVNYAYEAHETLQNMNLIKHEGRYYNPKKYKIHINTFLFRAFPNLKIKKLEVDDENLLKQLFLMITSEYLNIINNKKSEKASKYNNNYKFLIFRILFMKLFHKKYIRNLLRFIYIQDPSSFLNKDEKLREVNEKLECFKVFYYTPKQIYINNKYYTTKVTC